MQPALIPISSLQNNISSFTKLSSVSSKCEACFIRNKCFINASDHEAIEAFSKIKKRVIKINRGEYLYRSGDTFDTIYIIRNGSLKTSMIDDEGHEQILGFSMQGDFIGLNGLFSQSHITEAKALSTSYLCVVSLKNYLEAASSNSFMYEILLNKMSERIIEEEKHSFMLITKNAKQRLAIFLLNQIKNNINCGLPEDMITLHMSRRDIGNYIAAAVETVSRIFTQLQNKGILEVHGKKIKIYNMNGLELYAQ